jgi:DNA-binding NtrC family response regulator
MSRILVVDDEPSIAWGLKQILTDLDHQVQVAGTAPAALAALDEFLADAIFLDVRLPGVDGLTVLPELKQRRGDIPVVVMTAFGDLNTAVRALQQGAFDYLTKPFDLDQAVDVVDRALRSRQQESTTSAATAKAAEPVLLGSSPAMQAVFKQIALVAATDVPVLITGETGTGKELAAQAIHRHGSRPSGPFVPVCLATLNPTVIESELFGHVRGAFTGATDDRRGLIELAEQGTLFLDEIGDTPPSLQVKLLRFLETQQFARVGSGQLRTANVRVVAATNRPVGDLVAQGEFREDFLFRLRGFEIPMPPLRDRAGDVVLLAKAFASQARHVLVDFTSEFEQVLLSRTWTGNVRELRWAIEHAVILSRGGVLLPQHLPADHASRPVSSGRESLNVAVRQWIAQQAVSSERTTELYRTFLNAVEPPLLAEVLAACEDNRAAAARVLGLDRTTLRSKLRSHGIGE